jgi:RND family efflux transporter MFP subunit
MTVNSNNIPGNILQFALCVSTCLLFTVSCAKEQPEPEPFVRPVKIQKLSETGEYIYNQYPGRVRASSRAALAFEVDGRVVVLAIREGQDVTNGQLIAKLDPRDFEARLGAETANKNQLQVDFESSSNLYVKEVISRIEYLKSKRNYEVALERVKTAQKAFEDSVLVAPFRGTVSKRYIDNFENILAKQEIVQLDNLEVIEIVIDIPERDIAFATRSSAEHARAIFDALPNTNFAVTVKEFATQADPDTQTFRIIFKMNAPKKAHILPGMSARIKVPFVKQDAEGVESKAFYVPVNAVFPDDAGNKFVWVINPDDMRVTKRPVVTSMMSGKNIAITEGLKPGEMIATSGVFSLREGEEVKEMNIDDWK